MLPRLIERRVVTQFSSVTIVQSYDGANRRYELKITIYNKNASARNLGNDKCVGVGESWSECGWRENIPLPFRDFRGTRDVVLMRSTSATSGLGELRPERRGDRERDGSAPGDSTAIMSSSTAVNNDDKPRLGALSANGAHVDESCGWMCWA